MDIETIVSEIQDLHRDNTILSKGVAAQAKTIRELREELSKVTAQRDIHAYNEEFLKRQGRITRLKLRSAKKGRKQAEEATRLAVETTTSFSLRNSKVEGWVRDLRHDNRMLSELVVLEREHHRKALRALNTAPNAEEAQRAPVQFPFRPSTGPGHPLRRSQWGDF